jgi:hypothetical protein
MTRLWFATIACVIGLGLIVQANIAHAKLEDILYEKGQITKEEWVKAKADAEREEATIQGRAAREARSDARALPAECGPMPIKPSVVTWLKFAS